MKPGVDQDQGPVCVLAIDAQHPAVDPDDQGDGGEPSSMVWSFEVLPAGLADDIDATGARFVVSPLDPLAELVRAQRLAVHLGEAKGLDPDHPCSLSFSVILAAER